MGMTTTCTCPKRANEQGVIERVGLDVCCPTHGDPAPHAARQPPVDLSRAFALPEQRLGCESYNQVRAELEALRATINTPHTQEFLVAVEMEALHQRERWAADHDAGKDDADWFWLIGYLAGKALHKPEKQLHHIVTTAAACLNWHAMKTGADTRMRPGIGGSGT